MAVSGAGAWYRWRQQLKALPPGFAAANGLVVVPTAAASIWLIVHELIGVPVAGSIPLFLSGTVLYQISVGPLGILPATITSSMGQFGLLLIPVDTVLDLLSGSTIPMASIPPWLQTIMQLAPTIHFIDVSRAVLYRGAGLDIVWLLLLALSAFSIAVLGISLIRFRTAVRT
jgi:ABC-2 type transport system permease protein